MLRRLDDLLARGITFGLETTLATRVYQQKIATAQQQGYHVMLLYFWLSSPELAKARVATRVQEGGHNIPPPVIERRYWQGLRLLFDLYLPLVDEALLFDNSGGKPRRIAEKLGDNFCILNDEVYGQLKDQYEAGKAH